MRLHATSFLAAALSVVLLQAAPALHEGLTGRQVFPVTNWWNQDISAAPVDPQSQSIFNWISGRNTSPSSLRRLHPDFGPSPYGIPYVVDARDQR